MTSASRADGLTDRVRGILIALAGRRETISYRDLATAAEVPPPQTIHKLAGALEALIAEDAAAGRPPIAALVVGRGSGGLPQRGYFECLAAHGLYLGPAEGPAAALAHGAQLEAAWRSWGAEAGADLPEAPR